MKETRFEKFMWRNLMAAYVVMIAVFWYAVIYGAALIVKELMR